MSTFLKPVFAVLGCQMVLPAYHMDTVPLETPHATPLFTIKSIGVYAPLTTTTTDSHRSSGVAPSRAVVGLPPLPPTNSVSIGVDKALVGGVWRGVAQRERGRRALAVLSLSRPQLTLITAATTTTFISTTTTNTTTTT